MIEANLVEFDVGEAGARYVLDVLASGTPLTVRLGERVSRASASFKALVPRLTSGARAKRFSDGGLVAAESALVMAAGLAQDAMNQCRQGILIAEDAIRSRHDPVRPHERAKRFSVDTSMYEYVSGQSGTAEIISAMRSAQSGYRLVAWVVDGGDTMHLPEGREALSEEATRLLVRDPRLVLVSAYDDESFVVYRP